MSKFDLSNTCLTRDCMAGEVAVITGATSNVGKGYAQALAWAGAKVVVVGRSIERGNAVAAEINADNGDNTAIFVKADVTSVEDMQNVKDKALEAFGKVTILINNAMDMNLSGKILSSKLEDLDAAYAISARAVMIAAQLFMPDMIANHHGAVAYSTTQFQFFPGMLGGSVYTAGKAAATSVTMSLAAEVAGTGVNVFCLCPAGVGAFNPQSLKDNEFKTTGFAMPGFYGLVPADAAGAAMVYTLTVADKMHDTGLTVGDALVAMDYPFPRPETVVPKDIHYLTGKELTMAFCHMGHPFPGKE